MIESFRDPMGTLSIEGNQVRRAIVDESWPIIDLANILHQRSPHMLIQTLIASQTDRIVTHPKVFFPSYPYEWCPSQLWQAASRTLDLQQEALQENHSLKDASAYNILFEYTNPLFIDILSFEPIQTNYWIAYSQFCAHFIYPLLIYAKTKIEVGQLFKVFPDGCSASDLKRWFPKAARAKPSIYLFGWLAKVERKFLTRIERSSLRLEPKKLYSSLLKSLRKTLASLRPQIHSSMWSSYDVERTHYSTNALAEKKRVVEKFLDDFTPSTLLDMGCNRGEYAILAAKRGCNTVAIDRDESCIEQLYQMASKEKIPLLSLVFDLANPSPSKGFFKKERFSFFDRVQGSFEAIFCLSILHHLILAERLPLEMFFEFLKNSQARWVLLEWIDPEDEKVLEISDFSKDRLFQLERCFFEKIVRSFCKILSVHPLPSTKRAIYVLEFTS